MHPTIKAGDNVKVQFYTNRCVIDVDDIIVYHSWTVGAYVKHMWIGHRVIEKYREGGPWCFRTKGDNCPEPDPWKVPERAILGKIVSVEHTERSYAPTEISPQTESSRTTRSEASLPEGPETFLLIAVGFCLGAILAALGNPKIRRERTILKRAGVYSCHNCRNHPIRYTHIVNSMNGRIGLQETLSSSKLADFPRRNFEHYQPKTYPRS